MRVTHLHDGVLEVVKVDWFEALEVRVSATQVIEYRRHSLLVVIDVIDNCLDNLHELERVTFEPRVTDQFILVQVTKAEDGLNQRISTEYQHEYS